MKKVFEVSRNEVSFALIAIKKFIRPDAFLLGKVVKFLDDNLLAFNTPMVRVTIESVETVSQSLPKTTE